MEIETAPSSGLAAAFADVVAFHQACSIKGRAAPGFPARSRIDLRDSLNVEEFNELADALAARDLVATADAIGDLIYVLMGMAYEFGIPLPAVWDAIHRSNMAKVDPATGKVVKRHDGKILKPEGWQPPNVAAVLGIKGGAQ